jgi:hypothetical protein
MEPDTSHMKEMRAGGELRTYPLQIPVLYS